MDEMDLTGEEEVDRTFPQRNRTPLFSFRPLGQHPSRRRDFNDLRTEFDIYRGPIGDTMAGTSGRRRRRRPTEVNSEWPGSEQPGAEEDNLLMQPLIGYDTDRYLMSRSHYRRRDAGVEEKVDRIEAEFAQHQRSVMSSIRIRHWQLRDLVRCPFQADDVFVVKGNSVIRYDVTKEQEVDRTNFLFEPTCFGFGEAFVGVAGEGSEFGIQPVSAYREPSGIPHEHPVGSYSGLLCPGGHVNNAIKITRDLEGKLSIFLCNNDGRITILNVLNSNHETLVLSEAGIVESPVPVNSCSIADRERTLVHVGDSKFVYVHRATPTGYQLASTFSEASDAGMSCDWNSTGSQFATASQDGLVCVWDRRHRYAVAKMKCQRAARCVKYAPAPYDLLAFTEHRQYLHLVDCRMWEQCQRLKANDALEYDPDISGFDFSPCGQNLYVGTESSIEVFKINTGLRTSFPCKKFA